MTPHKVVIVSALLALEEHYKHIKVSMPDRASVQAMHKQKKWTLPAALQCLSPIMGPGLVANARAFVASVQRMTDEQLRKKHPHIADLYNQIPSDAVFGEKNAATYKEPPRHERVMLIEEVNRLRRQRALAPLDPERCNMTIAELTERVAKLKKSLAADLKAHKPTILPPGVAQGAYKNGREAMTKTATKKPATTKAAPKSKPRKLDDGEISLGQIASSLNIAPRHARIIARKNKAAVQKLEVKGKKYVFVKGNRDAVVKILRG